MSPRWVYAFSDPIEGDTREQLGGKGASLVEMTRAGFPVPPGFTISTEACRYFFDHDQQWPEGLESEIRAQMEALQRTTQRRFGRGSNPLLVAVRSGAAVSMPGMMDTILNCGLNKSLFAVSPHPHHLEMVYIQYVISYGKTVNRLPETVFPEHLDLESVEARYAEVVGKPFPQDPWQQLIECINAVFLSWDSERAKAYRQRHGITGLKGTAVNVQAMFPAEVSGVAFTHDPNATTSEFILIESSFGLGESVVSGEVTPDRFWVRRETLEPVRILPGRKTHVVAAADHAVSFAQDQLTLSPEAIRELAALCLRIEEHFGKPMDIEWGYAAGKFSLLQCRPIRGLEILQEAERLRQETIQRLKRVAGGERRVWVAHNLGETLRCPTPLTWDIVRQFMSGTGGFGQMYKDLGYSPSGEACRDGFLELILGRIYADPVRLAAFFWGRSLMEYDVDVLTRDKSALDRPPIKFNVERVDEKFLIAIPQMIRTLWRASRTAKRLRAHILDDFESKVLPPYLDYVRSKRHENLVAMQTKKLLDELEERRDRVLTEFGKESLKAPFFAGLAVGELESLLIQIFGSAEGRALLHTLTLGLDNDITYEQGLMLKKVAAGEVSFNEFLERFGHRAANEMELSEPRWREDASFIERLITQFSRSDSLSLEHRHHLSRRQAQAAMDELPARLRDAGASALEKDIVSLVHEARSLLPYREIGKYYLMMGYELIRQVLVELSRRWELADDIFFLQYDELIRFESEPERFRGLAAQRKLGWKAAQRFHLPEIVDSTELDTLGSLRPIVHAEEIPCEPLSSGSARGPVRLVFDPHSAFDLGRDYVLVCPSTDPGWTPLFAHAAALVVERGGLLSHGAIVARDFGIPAVVYPDATTTLSEGEIVQVDGDQGRILRVRT